MVGRCIGAKVQTNFGSAAHIEEFNEVTKRPVQTLKINDDSVHHELTYNEKRRTLKFDNE